MLTELCAECRNYFLLHYEKDIHCDEFTIENGNLDVDFLSNGQYFRIVGSALNDGVHQYGDCVLADETFDGSVWAMHVPQAFVNLSNEIDAWMETNATVLNSPYSSESFAGYSYSKAISKSGGSITWLDQFGSRLNAYRRISVL